MSLKGLAIASLLGAATWAGIVGLVSAVLL